MEIINTTALISINETVIVQLLSFLIFLFIINRLMFRPLRNAMNAREEYIEKIRQDISKAANDMAAFTKKMEAQKKAAINEAFRSSSALESDGRATADGIISSAIAEISTLREKAMQDTDRKISEARKGLRKESEKLAVGIMEKILERRLT